MIEIEYYRFYDGSNPIDPYLDSLEPKMRAKVLRTLALLEEFGTELRMPHSEYLGNGIFELRIKIGSNIERILYFYCPEGKAVLTNGFTKKQRRTPENEIVLARRRKAEYERRQKDE